MLELLGWFSVFALSLLVLIRASDVFTERAEIVGRFFGLPPFAIGVAIVAIGTSLPELMSSTVAVVQGSSEIAIGNVIGSNIANIFLIIGITATFGKKIVLEYEIASIDLPLFLGATLLMALMVSSDGFTIGEAVLSVLAYVVYLLYTVSQRDREEEIPGDTSRLSRLPKRAIVVLVLSSVFIFLGADYTVRSVVEISRLLDIAPDIIAISALAFGTSLPELTVSIVCARKGNPEVAVGNVLGSNIFNSLMVTGVPRFFGEVAIPEQTLTNGLLEMLAGTLLLCIVVQDKQITKWEGCLFLLFYVWFIGGIFGIF
ncbi:MAG: calcium/sodium antiporter [Geitlerinemataceae cyanobacterium]